MNEIEQNVLNKIREGRLRMKPRAYFVAQIVLLAAVALLALLAAVFATSFGFFALHESGEFALFGFGSRGLVMLIKIFPWFTLAAAIGLIFLLEFLLRRFKWSLRVPIFNLFAFAFVASLILGALISLTPLHRSFLDLADHDRLPVFGDTYRNLHAPHESEGEFRGTVTAVGTSTLTITHNDLDTDIDDGTRTVLCPPAFDLSQIHVGDRVYVAGDTDGAASGTIPAYGIRKL